MTFEWRMMPFTANSSEARFRPYPCVAHQCGLVMAKPFPSPPRCLGRCCDRILAGYHEGAGFRHVYPHARREWSRCVCLHRCCLLRCDRFGAALRRPRGISVWRGLGPHNVNQWDAHLDEPRSRLRYRRVLLACSAALVVGSHASTSLLRSDAGTAQTTPTAAVGATQTSIPAIRPFR